MVFLRILHCASSSSVQSPATLLLQTTFRPSTTSIHRKSADRFVQNQRHHPLKSKHLAVRFFPSLHSFGHITTQLGLDGPISPPVGRHVRTTDFAAMCTSHYIEYRCKHRVSRGNTRCFNDNCQNKKESIVHDAEDCPQCEYSKKWRSGRWCPEGCRCVVM
jgi:hypothetical protein